MKAPPKSSGSLYSDTFARTQPHEGTSRASCSRASATATRNPVTRNPEDAMRGTWSSSKSRNRSLMSSLVDQSAEHASGKPSLLEFAEHPAVSCRRKIDIMQKYASAAAKPAAFKMGSSGKNKTPGGCRSCSNYPEHNMPLAGYRLSGSGLALKSWTFPYGEQTSAINRQATCPRKTGMDR